MLEKRNRYVQQYVKKCTLTLRDNNGIPLKLTEELFYASRSHEHHHSKQIHHT